MPESPPVLRALRPASRSEPLYEVSPWSGFGCIFFAKPGKGCDCLSKGGFGYFSIGFSISQFPQISEPIRFTLECYVVTAKLNLAFACYLKSSILAVPQIGGSKKSSSELFSSIRHLK